MGSQTIRVLFWADDFGSQIGGAEAWGERYVTSMIERGHDLAVIAADGAGQSVSRSTDGLRIPLHRIAAGEALRGANTRAFTARVQDAARILGEFRPDLIHLSIGMSAPSQLLFLLAYAAASQCRPPEVKAPAVLASLHCEWPERFIHPGCLLERVLAQAHSVSCFSQAMLRWTLDRWPELSTRSSAIPQALLHTQESEAVSTPPEHLQRIAFIGRLSPEKGADIALRVFQILRQQLPGLQMVLAGDGQERNSLNDLAQELGVREHVSFPGWLSEEDVRSLIRSSQLVLIPSRKESFGLVALEAAREGRPLVAARVGGLPEVCFDGETGILCPPEDPDAMSAAAMSLLTQPEFAERMGRAARVRFNLSMSWEAHLDAYENLMRLTLERTARSAASQASRLENIPA